MNVIHCQHKNCQMTPLDGCKGPCLTDAVKAFNNKVSGKRKPLSRDDACRLLSQLHRGLIKIRQDGGSLNDEFEHEINLIRAVERAHGIGGES